MKHFTVLLVLLVAALQVFSQDAPTGAHYAGRPSDTGFGGTFVDATGNYPASVPLDLPEARGNLPVPLQIVYGGRGVGAAGLGWHIPLSYIQRDWTFAHRRPIYTGQYNEPSARGRAYLSLLGQGYDLMKRGGVWVARTGTLELAVRESGDMWFAYDGQGRTYTFVHAEHVGSTGLWLLKSVSSAGGARLEITYKTTNWEPQGTKGIEISVERIAYNPHPYEGCTKHEVALNYGSTGPTLSLSILGDKVLIRKVLLREINVMSRASCSTAPERLRRYTFQYTYDPDTRLPRLRGVVMFGRQGTLEENTSLPIASYDYGNATRDGKLTYRTSQIINLPADDPASTYQRIGTTNVDSSVVAPGSGEEYATWHSLTDATGDGRPDLIFKKNNKLWMSRNLPASQGRTALSPQTVQLHDNTFKKGAISTHKATKRRHWWGSANRNIVDIWRQAIDVNGDGRIDIVDAGEKSDRWIIYLNTPGPTGVTWQRRSFWIKKLREEIKNAGHELPGSYLPLSRKTTGISVRTMMCIESGATGWEPYDGKLYKWISNGNDPPTKITYTCEKGVPTQFPHPVPECKPDKPEHCRPPDGEEPERTFTEWEFSDLNGDSYPDFVFNSFPVDFELTPTRPPDPVYDRDWQWIGDVRSTFKLRNLNAVRVAFNVTGVRFEEDEKNAFARSVGLLSDAPRGVGMWEGVNLEGDTTQQLAGFAEVNGDGLMDYVSSGSAPERKTSAILGVYAGTRMFAGSINLPYVLSEQYSPRKKYRCRLYNNFYESQITRGLRDLTGDGVPDYYSQGQAYIGTGAGFTSAVPVLSPDVRLMFSHQTESCDGNFSNSDGGMFDIDGDGKPEIIGIVQGSSPGQLAYIVTPLAGGSVPGVPEAGRLTAMHNGFGATTHIRYVSAKERPEMGHQVPFPEIVVSSVETIGVKNFGGTLSPTLYAYGGAELIFDSALDRWVFPGYLQFVELKILGRHVYGAPNQTAATVTATWPLTPFDKSLSKKDRWLRMQRVGRTQDIFTLRNANTDPWSILGIDQNHPSVVGVTHYEWDAKVYETPDFANNFRECMDMVHPYSFDRSFIANEPDGLRVCRSHGFAFGLSKKSWFGPWAPPTTNNIQTLSQAVSVDDFGRVTYAKDEGDLFRHEDDICVETRFATPNGNFPRVLTAVASRRMVSCDGEMTVAKELFEYDQLPWGAVSHGRITSRSTERYSTSSGLFLSKVRAFDATYDSRGNLNSVRTQRTGATRTVNFQYDIFGLVPIYSKVDATGVPSTESSVSYDILSLLPLSSRDANQTQRGSEFDGFGRLVRSTVTPPGGTRGVTATVNYQGFTSPSPGDSGRRVVVKEFSNAVAPSEAATTPGRLSISFFDELGRPRQTFVDLGLDYGNKILVVGGRKYDGLGRVVFEADPYPATQHLANAYGTTYHFDLTGDLDCVIRGRGQQPLNRTTDVAAERFPTCFQRSFVDHVDTLDVRDAAALMPQGSGIVKRVVSTGIGRVIERSTLRNGKRLDYATFSHDRLGQQNTMTRFLQEASGVNQVMWWWELDSLGQTLALNEPQTAQRNFSYSDWGEPIETRWTEGGINRAVRSEYDALGRLTRSSELNNGIPDAATIKQYSYDVGVNVSSQVTPTFVLGRLARASSPSGQTAFSYDAFGRVNARTFSDREGRFYVEKSRYMDDGNLAMLEFNLPDRNYKPERVSYTYDTAGRLRTMNHADTSGFRELYRAHTIDIFGRVRKADYGGNANFSANYAEEGRRLIQEASVVSSLGTRIVKNLQFDELNREVSRLESTNSGNVTTRISYEALGRVSTVTKQGQNTISSWRYTYDSLGNVTRLMELSGAPSAFLTYHPAGDLDRICRVRYGTGSAGNDCNVTHDGLGNVVNQPTRTGSRQLSYYLSGDVRTIHEGSIHASFAYDALGRVQELNVQGDSAQDKRRDRRYGDLIELREVTSGTSTSSILMRNIPGPGGTLARRRGPGNDWVFEFGELRGNRFFTDQNGAFIQDVDYAPFGEPKSTGQPAGSAKYTSYQWNGRDALAAFNLSHLGARVYDPVIGRFLSRDPLVIPRSSSRTNPYAFAMNDPVNAADPSGLDCIGESNCRPLDPLPFSGGGAGSGSDSDSGYWPIFKPPSPRQAPLASSDPSTESGRVLKFWADGKYGRLGNAFDYDSLARAADDYADAMDRIANTTDAHAAIDEHNATCDAVGSFCAGIGDRAINRVSGMPNAGRVLRSTIGIQSGDANPTAYGAGEFAYEVTENVVTKFFGGEVDHPESADLTAPRATTGFVATEKGNVDVRPTIQRINAGLAFPHRNDGSIFGNREGLLPSKPQGYYREFVHPTPGVVGPGAMRIVRGLGGELYYTPDHYKTFIPLN